MSEQEAKEKRIARRRRDNFIVWFLVWPIAFSISAFVAAWILRLMDVPPDTGFIMYMAWMPLAGLFGAGYVGHFYHRAMKAAEED